MEDLDDHIRAKGEVHPLQKSMSLKYEPSSEPLHFSVKPVEDLGDHIRAKGEVKP